MITSHNDIEKSFHRYILDNLETPFSYAVNYGEIRFDSNPHDFWLSIVFEEIGAGAKKFSPVRIDTMSKITTEAFNDNEVIAIDRMREVFTNARILLYTNWPNSTFPLRVPTVVSGEIIIVKNGDGRFTVDKVILNNLREEDVQQELRRSSVFLRAELLTDTVGGRTV